MPRKSERLETINNRSVSEESSQPKPETRARNLERQRRVEKRRSTSVPIQRRRILSSGSGGSDQEEILLASTESIEWDSSYDKCSTLKDISDILDLTITQTIDQATRSESVAYNLVPAEFALQNSSLELDDQDLPIPSVLTVHGLSSLLELSDEEELDVELKSEEEISANKVKPFGVKSSANNSDEEEELQQRLNRLRDSTSSMDETEYRNKLKELRRVEIKIKTQLKEFTTDHVTYEDRESYKEKLLRIGEKYLKWRDDAIDLVADLDPDNQTDKVRIEKVEEKVDEVVALVANHAKDIKVKVVEVVSAHDASSPPAVQLHPPATVSVDMGRKKDVAIKMKMKSARMEKRAKELISRVGNLPEPPVMPERDIRREISVEFPERDKECRDIRDAIYDALENLATVDDDMRELDSEDRLNNVVDEMNQVVLERKVLIRSLDKSLGLCTEYPNPAKSTVPTPDIFEGKVGTNVYKFKEKFEEYIDAAQIREKDKVETLRKFLSGEAKMRIGEHYKTIKEALKCLIDNYGNPRAIWAESKKDLSKMVGNYNRDWGKHGSQLRVSAIGRCVEFLREAEVLAKDYSELENDVYSTSTFELLTQVLPYTYTEKIDDEIGDVRTTDRQKMTVIREYLEVKMQGALVAASRHCDDTTLPSKERGYGGHADPNDDHPRGGAGGGQGRGRGGANQPQLSDHDCSKDRRCKTEWSLLGCVELYTCKTVSERKELMRSRRGCWKCGDFPCQNFFKHKCSFTNKEAVWCTEQGCKRAAAMCELHSSNASSDLKKWLRENKIKTTVNFAISNIVITVTKDTTMKSSGVNEQDMLDLQSGKAAKYMPDSELVEYFEKCLDKHGVSKPKVNPYPAGECVFLYCLIKGKTRPVQAFIDGGCNTMLSREGVPETELVSAKLMKGPIPIGVAGGGVIMASGLWGTLLPLNDGSDQIAKTLTMETITADMNVVDLKSVFEDIKSKSRGIKALQNLKVPKEVGGKIDLLIGLNLLAVHPEPVHTFPSGLTVYKSKFKPPWPGVLGCIGGPVEALQCIAGISGNIAALGHLQSLAYLTKDFVPRLEFFPDIAEFMPMDPEMNYLNLVEKDTSESTSEVVELSTCPIMTSSDLSPSSLQSGPNGDAGWEEGGRRGEGVPEHHGHCVLVIPGPEQDGADGSFVCEDCFYCPCNMSVAIGQVNTIEHDMRRFMEYQEAGLDQGYKCPRCRSCKNCKRGAAQERISMKQEAEQEVIRESVTLDEHSNRAVVKLAFIADPVQNLKPNRYAALKRLDNVCKKYANEPNAIKMICDKVAKLHKTGHIKYWEDFSADQKKMFVESPSDHYLCWDVGFKEDSLSTPARPVFDGSARTPGGTSLNDILAKGITNLARLVEVQLVWMMGRFALTGDVSQAYNAMLLAAEHWVYQRVLLKDGLNISSKVREAVIVSAIYGVRCVGGQLEVLCGLLAELCEEEFPEVAEFLRKFRYVDDFAKSVDTLKELLKLIEDTEKVLAKASLVVKDWAWTGKDPPEKMSADGVSVCLAGLVWYTKLDTYRLNLDSLHFGVKKRGRYPPGTVKLHNTDKSMDEFVPKKLTRRNCARVAARVYDLRGDVAPLLLRLKYDLRGLIHKKYDWDDVLDMASRERWVENFSLMEEVRKFMFNRCPIPVDAVKMKGRLWIMVDAANGGLVMAAFCGFLRKDGTYSCERVFAKGLLCPEGWTIPARELQALAMGADTATFLGNTLGHWLDMDEIYLGSDSRIALAWVVYERVKLDVYYRNRVSQIRSQVGLNRLFHVEGKENVADIGTRPDILSIEHFCPGSEWEKGKPWMKLEVKQAEEQGVIKPVEMIKLEDEEKKAFKKGITYDDFTLNPMIVALSARHGIDHEKIQQRLEFSEYLFNPLLRSFKSVVRITALVLKAVRLFKRKRIQGLIRDGKVGEEALKESDVPPAKFTVFAVIAAIPSNDSSILNEEISDAPAGSSEVDPIMTSSDLSPPVLQSGPNGDAGREEGGRRGEGVRRTPAPEHTSGQYVLVVPDPKQDGAEGEVKYKDINNLTLVFMSNCTKLSDLGIILTEEDLSAALTYLYTKATMEIYKFVPKKIIEKEGIESEGILYAKTRILEGQELRVMGELDEMLDLESFTGVKFKVPLLEKHSPLAICIAFHIHNNVAPHKGSESVYRISLQHAKVINGKSLYLAVEEDCIRCKILKKKYLEQMMGPLADSQISISPVFYFSLLDLWGPIRTYCPGYERTGYTRGSVAYAKHYEVYFMVVACVVTGAVNVQVVEKKDTGAILDGLSRFFNECCVPKVMLPDADGALMEALRDGIIELSNLEGTLSVEHGIHFEPCLPQGHWEHGRVERRIRMLQESLDRSGLKGTRCHATGLQTIAKAIERQVNDVPLGLLEQSTRSGNVLRILTPNMLKMNTRSDRAPKGLLTIPGHASDLIKNVEKGFKLWFQVWNDVYLPRAAEYKKWHGQKENLCVGDIVLFKLKDSVLASTWKIGKVDAVDIGRDGLVRGADISYKIVEMGRDDVRHMVVQRPVRQIVKLFHLNDTTLLSDISKVRKATEDIINKKNRSTEDAAKDSDPQDKHLPDQTEYEDKQEVKPNVKDEEEEKFEEETLKQESIKEEKEDYETDESQKDVNDDNEAYDDQKTGSSQDGNDNHLSDIDDNQLSGDDDITPSEDYHQSLPDNEDHHERAKDQNDEGAAKKKSELEKLLIDNDQFWKNFDERKPRGTLSDSPFWTTDDQVFMFHTIEKPMLPAITELNYNEGWGQMDDEVWGQVGADDDGAVFLL